MEVKRRELNLADKLSQLNLSNVIVGEAITSGSVTIVPLSKVKWGWGYGLGRKEGKTMGEGAGVGGSVLPIGYIEISDEHTTFKPIRSSSLTSIVTAIGISSLFLFPLLRRFFKK